MPVRRENWLGNGFADKLRKGIRGLRPRRDRLVHGHVIGRPDRAPGLAEDQLARCPDDIPKPVHLRCREHVVRRDRIDPEGLGRRQKPGAGHSRQVDNGVLAAEDVARLAEISQIRDQALALRRSVRAAVDVEHVVAVRAQVRDDHASGLATAARHYDPHVASPPGQLSADWSR